MAALLTTVLLLLTTSSLTSTSEAGKERGGLPIVKKGQVRWPWDDYSTATYWGRLGKEEEGSLRDTCEQYDSGRDILIISGLVRFGSGREPALNLSDHCDPGKLFGCTSLSDDIRACQDKGIKVLLSIGGAYDGKDVVYSLESEEEANELAGYLWNNFLRGFSFSRPLGNAALDGIDFDIRGGGVDGKWDVLASKLSAYNLFIFKLVYLSAGVQRSIPDPYLDSAVKTGVFDYIWVRLFGDESCEYEGNVDSVLKSWGKWDSYRGVKQLFLAIPEDAGNPGCVPEEVLFEEILPEVINSPGFGGVLIKKVFL